MTTDRAHRLARLLLLPPALFALACALFAPAEAGRAPAARRATQNREKGEEVPSNSTVRGRVVYDDTSRPVRRARVSLVGAGGTRTEYGALTDSRGDFQIKGVRAGSYLASVSVPGVLTPGGFMGAFGMPGGGMPDPGDARKFFDFIEVNGKDDVAVTVHARRGGTIAGRVTYADGDPATGVTVTLMRRDSGGQLQKYVLGSSFGTSMGNRTDDRGQFRVTGLPPGEYYVAVSEAVAHGEDSGRDYDAPSVLEEMVGQQLLQTFHPSASSVKEAAPVKVETGEERADVDIVIPDRELRTVAGVVRTRRGGRPVAHARVSISRREDPANSAPDFYVVSGQFSRNSTTTDEDGRWQLKEIPDGAYTILVKPPEEYEAAGAAMMNSNFTITNANVTIVTGNMNGGSGAPRRRKGFAPARRDVDVSGGDLSEVAVEVSEGARVSGTVTVEGALPPFAYIYLLRVPDGGGRSAPSDVHNANVEAGRFTADGLDAGKFFIHASTYDEDTKFYVKSITWKGRDLLREPLELGEGASADGVEVVFSRNPATLRVSAVAAPGGKRAPGAGVFLVPADAGEWQPYGGQQLFCWTEEDGLCSVAAPPGEYRVVALPQRLMRAAPEAEVRRRAAAAPRVSLRAGETKELEVVASDR